MTDGWEKARRAGRRAGAGTEASGAQGKGRMGSQEERGKRLGGTSPVGQCPQTRGFNRGHGSRILAFCIRATGLSSL